MDNNFKAENIKPGYLGVFADGTFAIAMNVKFMRCPEEIQFVTNGQLTADRGAYISAITAFNGKQDFEYALVAVYGYPTNYQWFSTENRPLLWKREKPVIEMTIAEIEHKLNIKNLKIVKEISK